MTPSPHASIATPLTSTVSEPPREPRLRLKPMAPTTGYVDGAWWPRSRGLATELSAVLALLATRLGQVERVSYSLTTWPPAVRGLTIGGHTIRLEGFRSQDPDTVTVVGQDGKRLTLLVVPPETDATAAHHAVRTASQPDNVDSPKALLVVVS